MAVREIHHARAICEGAPREPTNLVSTSQLSGHLSFKDLRITDSLNEDEVSARTTIPSSTLRITNLPLTKTTQLLWQHHPRLKRSKLKS